MENGLTSVENPSGIRKDFESRPSSSATVVLENERSTFASILDATETSVVHAAPQKQKRKLKVPKPVLQNVANDRSTIQRQEKNDDVQINSSRRNSQESPLRKLAPPSVSCNIVNLRLNDLNDSGNKEESKDTNHISLHRTEKRKPRCKEIQDSLKTNIAARHSIHSEEETKLKNGKGPVTGSQRDKTKILETHPKETDHSVSFYQRFLSFNVPENTTRFSRDDSIRGFNVSARSNAGSGILSARGSKVTDFETGKNSPKLTTNVTTHSLTVGNEKYNNVDDIRINRNIEALNSELEASRSKKIEEKASATSFQSGNCFNSDKELECDANDKYHDGSLPLTGDPEIDDEIIAFYKAKRSGGVY